MIQRPGIPSIDQAIDRPIRTVLSALKENAEIANGTRPGPDAWRKRSASLEMLVTLGLITEDQAKSVAQDP
jgi:hypothetical protein